MHYLQQNAFLASFQLKQVIVGLKQLVLPSIQTVLVVLFVRLTLKDNHFMPKMACLFVAFMLNNQNLYLKALHGIIRINEMLS